MSEMIIQKQFKSHIDVKSSKDGSIFSIAIFKRLDNKKNINENDI